MVRVRDQPTHASNDSARFPFLSRRFSNGAEIPAQGCPQLVRERAPGRNFPRGSNCAGDPGFQTDLFRGLEQFRFGRNLVLHFLGNDFGAIQQTCFLLVELEVHTDDADSLPAHVEGHGHIVAVPFFLDG
jgi:hypothetical protein